MPLRQFVVDAFTTVPFAGNPAAVVLLDEPAPDSWLQALAAENNLSETAYLLPDGNAWDLRWFTPTTEVDLCGHATLASAHVLFTELAVTDDVLHFTTRSGVLSATRAPEGRIGLDFPADHATPSAPGDPQVSAFLAAAGLEPDTRVLRGRTDYLAVVASPEAVCACDPDHRALGRLPIRGAIVTAVVDPRRPGRFGGYDVVSRFFAPVSGIDEDPVTGSAHCLLGPHWARELDRTDLVAFQASARGGTVHVSVRDDRVGLAGHAVTVLRAELQTQP